VEGTCSFLADIDLHIVGAATVLWVEVLGGVATIGERGD
jgi:hypothetical protein